MPSIHETVYPRLKGSVTAKELSEIYTPTADELALAGKVARGGNARLCLLLLLTTFQRLGYFAQLRDVPLLIINHLAACLGESEQPPVKLFAYDESGTRQRHVPVIRQYLNVRPYDKAAQELLTSAVREAAQTKEDLADIINVGLEELIETRHRQLWFGYQENPLWRGNSNEGGVFAPVELKDAATNQLRALLEDREGNIWLGTQGGGLLRLRPRRVMTLSQADGLPSNDLYAISEDSQGAVWFAMPVGMGWLSDGKKTFWTEADLEKKSTRVTRSPSIGMRPVSSGWAELAAPRKSATGNSQCMNSKAFLTGSRPSSPIIRPRAKKTCGWGCSMSGWCGTATAKSRTSTGHATDSLTTSRPSCLETARARCGSARGVD